MPLDFLSPEALAGQVPEFLPGAGAVLLDPDGHAAGQGAFNCVAARREAGIAGCKAQSEREADGLHEAVVKHATSVARLDEAIVHEAERVRRHGEVAAIAIDLQSRIDDIRRRIAVRDLAIDLLRGAIHYISQRFNTEVRNLSANSLPKFTNGRYEHLQIDENLKVKAFSSEKRDFMDLDEISGGTQRQIKEEFLLVTKRRLVTHILEALLPVLGHVARVPGSGSFVTR